MRIQKNERISTFHRCFFLHVFSESGCGFRLTIIYTPEIEHGYQKLPCSKGVTVSKPSFWVSMLVLGGVYHFLVVLKEGYLPMGKLAETKTIRQFMPQTFFASENQAKKQQ